MKRFTAKYVYTLDGNDPIRDGFVETDDDGTVLSVGKCDASEAADGALVPGFVNAHCHVELSHLYGKFRKGSGMAGFIDQINELRDSVPTQRKKELLAMRMEQMWTAGVSALADVSNCEDSFGAKAASPMYSRTFLEVFGSEPGDCDRVVSGARELEARAREYGIDASITPHACYTTSPQLLTASAAAGLQTGFLSYHSQESDQEEQMIRSGEGEMAENRRRAGMSMPAPTGTSSLEYFLGRLSLVHEPPFREHVLLVHNVCLDREAALRATQMLDNVFWAVCPLSNLFIHNTLPPLPLMRELGLDICIGTDSLSSNDDLDMVGEIYCIQKNFPDIPLEEILSWACLNGARFLGKEASLGSFAAGKRPGVVRIDGIGSDGRLTGSSRSVRLV